MAHGDHGHDHDHDHHHDHAHGEQRGPHLDKGHEPGRSDEEIRLAAGAAGLGSGQGGHDHAHGGLRHRPAAGEAPRIHRASAPRRVQVGVITASDTRTDENDTSGRYLAETLQDRGHPVLHRAIVRDEPALVQEAIAAARAAGAEAVIVTGGTGISRRDSTFEAIDGLLAKRIPGFGELFRLLSFQEIGSAAMLSRATAGVTAEGLVLFAVPGSTGACRTALERLILPELGHLVREVTK
ncbi:molybdenum cofactor biosynthesis protein B [Vulgatibacter sp.]|uniref:MogA/MoaB family molybdenum cofactor biosynthesis protein n=1 Tax=Vulgatibacter sp. TaxID=1971226 RepID=UPI00356B4CEA